MVSGSPPRSTGTVELTSTAAQISMSASAPIETTSSPLANSRSAVSSSG